MELLFWDQEKEVAMVLMEVIITIVTTATIAIVTIVTTATIVIVTKVAMVIMVTKVTTAIIAIVTIVTTATIAIVTKVAMVSMVAKAKVDMEAQKTKRLLLMMPKALATKEVKVEKKVGTVRMVVVVELGPTVEATGPKVEATTEAAVLKVAATTEAAAEVTVLRVKVTMVVMDMLKDTIKPASHFKYTLLLFHSLLLKMEQLLLQE
jgi:hypothetical protein